MGVEGLHAARLPDDPDRRVEARQKHVLLPHGRAARPGKADGEFFGKSARVLIVAAEDAREDMWKPRLQAAGADFDLTAFLDMPDGWNVRDGVALIAAALDEYPAALVFIDAVMEHLPDAPVGERARDHLRA